MNIESIAISKYFFILFMTTKITSLAMFAIAAFAIGGLTVSTAYAWSVISVAEDDWTIPSGTDFTLVDDGGECNNDVIVTTNTVADTITIVWDGNVTCNSSLGHPGSPSHAFSKVRVDLFVDGTHYEFTKDGAYDYNGNKTYNQ